MTDMLDPTGVEPLIEWGEEHAALIAAPPGQPNAAAERMTEIVMFLKQHRDLQSALVAQTFFRTGIDSYNATQRDKCDARRADAVPCGGNGKTVKCSDCPKRMGLSLTMRVLV